MTKSGIVSSKVVATSIQSQRVGPLYLYPPKRQTLNPDPGTQLET